MISLVRMAWPQAMTASTERRSEGVTAMILFSGMAYTNSVHFAAAALSVASRSGSTAATE
jgi:hypothetical protein